MIDVWLLRYNKPLRARGGDAQTMAEEFEVYGLPGWFRSLIRVMKLSGAVMMIAGIWHPTVALAAGCMLSVLMAGALAMHVKVRDPWLKSVPATFFLLLNVFVIYGYAFA